MFVVGRDRCARRIVAVIGPVGAGREAHGIDAKEIKRGFDVGRVFLWRAGQLHRRGFAILQQDEGPERGAKGKGGGGFADVIAVLRGLLHGLAHVAEKAAGEHVGAFGHAGDIGAVDIGGGFVHPFQRLERVRAEGVVAGCKRVAGAGGLGMGAKPGAVAGGRCLAGGDGLVRRHCQRRRDRSQTITVARERIPERAVFEREKARQGRQSAQVHVRGRHGMRPRLVSQGADIAGERHRGLHPAQTGAVGQGVLDPCRPGFIGTRRARVVVKKDQRVGMVAAIAGWLRHVFAQAGHDDVDARGKCLGLHGAQFFGQTIDIRVTKRIG